MQHPKESQELMAVKDIRPHVLAVPFPAQGHIMPLMKLCRKISSRGIKVTVVNAEHIHEKIIAAMSEEDEEQSHIELLSIPDGLQTEEERQNGLLESLERTMPGNLRRLIEKINRENCDEKVSCVIADTTIIGLILDVSKEVGAETAAFHFGAASDMALVLQIPKLIQQGYLDTNGSVMKNEMINLSGEIPAWRNNELPWSISSELKARKAVFECCQTAQQAVRQVKWLFCNTFYEFESPACDLIPNIYPVGPLLNSSASRGSIWTEDTTCLNWLDKQPVGSVIYVSFGSLNVLSQEEFHELALGLELCGRPFLWVLRSKNFVYPTPDGFEQRVTQRAKIVEWAHQEKVLAHSSVGCFLSHCGWNSTMEGISMGVPFLGWPCVYDQYHDQAYICDVWKIGLKLNPDETGLRSRHEISTKIQMLFSDKSFKANALKLKEVALRSVTDQSGTSFRNFENFVNYLKK